MADEDDGQVVVDMVKVEFANRTDFGEDKVNDGRNFQGLMNHKDYMKRKEELTEGLAEGAHVTFECLSLPL